MPRAPPMITSATTPASARTPVVSSLGPIKDATGWRWM